MKDQFVPYELAVKLKEMGFYGFEVFGYYNLIEYSEKWAVENRINPDSVDHLEAPLWQQAFDFLLKKYYLYSVIIPTITMDWTFKITTVVDEEIEVPPYKNVDATDYSTYEEAREACLKQLIELCQQN